VVWAFPLPFFYAGKLQLRVDFTWYVMPDGTDAYIKITNRQDDSPNNYLSFSNAPVIEKDITEEALVRSLINMFNKFKRRHPKIWHEAWRRSRACQTPTTTQEKNR
jgi:hypothetical protein